MRPTVWVPTNGVEFHVRRECPACAGAPSVDVLPAAARMLVLFDACPRCVPGAPRRPKGRVTASPSVLAAMRQRPPSAIERMRTEARRRGVTFEAWAGRMARLDATIDLTDARQSASVTS